METKDTLLTVRQLQDLLQVDRITIYRMLGDGRLRGFKVGGQWRFSHQAITSWLQEQQVRLVANEPAVHSGTLHPTEALSLSCMRAIQDILAQALGIAALNTAMDGTPLTPIANSCRFYSLILATELGRERCVGSWRAAAAGQGSTLQLATCHAGLRYISGRIEVESQAVAAVHAGQFLDRPPNHEGQLARLAELAVATGQQVEEMQAALALVPVLTREQRSRIPTLLQRVIAAFSEIGTERLNLLGRLHRIAEMTRL